MPFSDRRCARPAGLQFAHSALPRRQASRRRFSNRNGRLSQPARNVALDLPEPTSPARIAWSHESDSNRRPAVYETAALPAELSWPGQSRRYRFIYASTFARSSIRRISGRRLAEAEGRHHGSNGATGRCGPVGTRTARDRISAPPSVGQVEPNQQSRPQDADHSRSQHARSQEKLEGNHANDCNRLVCRSNYGMNPKDPGPASATRCPAVPGAGRMPGQLPRPPSKPVGFAGGTDPGSPGAI